MIVVDASALLEVLLRTPAAKAVEDRLLAARQTLHAPHLLDVEVAQVIRRYVTNGEIETGGLEFTVVKHTRRHLEATVGGGGPQVRVETTNGSVSVRGR